MERFDRKDGALFTRLHQDFIDVLCKVLAESLIEMRTLIFVCVCDRLLRVRNGRRDSRMKVRHTIFTLVAICLLCAAKLIAKLIEVGDNARSAKGKGEKKVGHRSSLFD